MTQNAILMRAGDALSRSRPVNNKWTRLLCRIIQRTGSYNKKKKEKNLALMRVEDKIDNINAGVRACKVLCILCWCNNTPCDIIRHDNILHAGDAREYIIQLTRTHSLRLRKIFYRIPLYRTDFLILRVIYIIIDTTRRIYSLVVPLYKEIKILYLNNDKRIYCWILWVRLSLLWIMFPMRAKDY